MLSSELTYNARILSPDRTLISWRVSVCVCERERERRDREIERERRDRESMIARAREIYI